MGDKLDEPEFWLPSEFLTDEHILMDNKSTAKSVPFCFPSEFPFDYGSSLLSSPVESVVGSTETENDEDDLLLTELTRQLTLQDTYKIDSPAKKNHEAWVPSGSPQSTLAKVESWSGRSSNGSPNGPSQVSSPPTTPLGVNNDPWDLIYQAASQVARLKMNGCGEGPTRYSGVLGPPVRLPTPPPFTNSFTASTFYHNQGQLKQEASGMWSRHGKNGWSYDSQGVLRNMGDRMGCGNAMGAGAGMGHVPSGWPAQQQASRQYVGQLGGFYSGCGHGYGLGYGSGGGGGGVSFGGGLKKGRSGTGVFLPRRYDVNMPTSVKASDTRKKPASSSVWVPNKNFEDASEIVRSNLSQYNAMRDFDAWVARRNVLLAQQRQRNPCPEGSISHEICLPQEWTY